MTKRAKAYRAYKSTWEKKAGDSINSWESKGFTLHADKVIALRFIGMMKADSSVRLSEGPYMTEISEEQWAHLRNFQTYMNWAGTMNETLKEIIIELISELESVSEDIHGNNSKRRMMKGRLRCLCERLEKAEGPNINFKLTGAASMLLCVDVSKTQFKTLLMLAMLIE